MNNIKKVIGGVVALFVLTLMMSFSKLVSFLADYNWFKEVGYTSTFLKQVFAKLYVGIPFFVVMAIFITAYLFGIKKSYYSHMSIGSTKEEEKNINLVIGLSSIALAMVFSFSISSRFWLQILKFRNSTQFNVEDPIFAKDIAFYVFKLPLINEIFSSLTGFLMFLLIVTIVFYFILVSIKPPARPTSFSRENIMDINSFRTGIASMPQRILNLALNQVIVIGIIFFIILALNNYLASFGLLYSARGVAYGASYTDVNVTLWVYRIQIVLSLISAGLLVLAYLKKKSKIALIGPILMIAVMFISTIVETGVQNFIVAPNEISKERNYLEQNIKYTRLAYGLDDVEVQQFPIEDNLTREELEKNEETIRNISINDYRPTKEVYNQIQGIRAYYTFNDVDVDRYVIDGKLTQVFLGAREMDKNRLESKTWLNQYVKYTHGYGVALSPVNEITPGGQPKMLIKNIPPVSDIEKFQITRPEIYFGEQRDDYILTNTSEKEFDYPKGDTNALSNYEGNAGINLTFGNKLLYALDQGSFKLLVAGGVDSNSKIIMHRNIMDRVRLVAPFLNFDEDPYITVVDGKLYWIIDGYTYTSKYPYSEPYDKTRINYVRNSFKVVVDAYNGTTDFYIVDHEDPIINTYAKIFKDLFKDKSQMPEGIMAHMRYPKSLFSIQAKTYENYHMMNAEVFYNKEDRWEMAKENYEAGTQARTAEPNYVTFKLPGEDKAEFLLTTSYTPTKKQNMTAILAGRNDGEDYGKLIVYKFPKEKTIFGPEQVENRIGSNPEISTRLTQWGSGGSTVIRGHLLTIPIENSILYVEPLYIRSDSTQSIPEVKRIVVSYKDDVVMAETLEEALEKLFGASKPSSSTDVSTPSEIPTDSQIGDLSQQELIIRANDLYEKSQQAIKAGDWQAYGDYIDELGRVLNQLK